MLAQGSLHRSISGWSRAWHDEHVARGLVHVDHMDQERWAVRLLHCWGRAGEPSSRRSHEGRPPPPLFFVPWPDIGTN